jgi:hypothetical protein
MAFISTLTSLESAIELWNDCIGVLPIVPTLDLSICSLLTSVRVKHINLTTVIVPPSINVIHLRFSKLDQLQVGNNSGLVRLAYLDIEHCPGVFSNVVRQVQQVHIDVDVACVTGEIIDTLSLGENITVRNRLHLYKCKLNRINGVEKLYNFKNNGLWELGLGLLSCDSPYGKSNPLHVNNEFGEVGTTDEYRMNEILYVNYQMDLTTFTTQISALRNAVFCQLLERWNNRPDDIYDISSSYCETAIRLSSNILRRSLEFVV